MILLHCFPSLGLESPLLKRSIFGWIHVHFRGNLYHVWYKCPDPIEIFGCRIQPGQFDLQWWEGFRTSKVLLQQLCWGSEYRPGTVGEGRGSGVNFPWAVVYLDGWSSVFQAQGKCVEMFFFGTKKPQKNRKHTMHWWFYKFIPHPPKKKKRNVSKTFEEPFKKIPQNTKSYVFSHNKHWPRIYFWVWSLSSPF